MNKYVIVHQRQDQINSVEAISYDQTPGAHFVSITCQHFLLEMVDI